MTLAKKMKVYAQETLNKIIKNNTVPDIQIILFTRQLATLLISGVPLSQSLEILENSQPNPFLKIIIFSIKREVFAGKMLYQALRLYPTYFNPLMCQLVRLGENIGKIDVILQQIAEHQEKNFAFKNQLKQILFYPCLILIAALVMTISMFLFVIPKFAALFSSSQHQLPFLTRVIFSLSTLLQYLIWPILSIFLLLIFFLSQQHYQKILQQWLKNKIVFLPFIQSLHGKFCLIQFINHLMLMQTSGMSIQTALQLSEEMAIETKSRLLTSIQALKFDIAAGIPLHKAFAKISTFPYFLTQMIKIGEESGQLEQMLAKIHAVLVVELDQTLRRLSDLLEPLIMLLLGVLIGALVIGMYQPIFKLGTIA